MAFKIYTKTGDEGTTGLFGGKRVSKAALRIEAYGTVDELNSNLGLLHDHLSKEDRKANLQRIQKQLFLLGSHLAVDPSKPMKLPAIKATFISQLEHEIDQMEHELPQLSNFILPGGHPLVSQTHICRTVCRRAERRVVALGQEEAIDSMIIPYLNRLSDYFFVLSRAICQDEEAMEIAWNADEVE